MNTFKPARNPGELFYDYQARRLMVNKAIKSYLRGTFMHVAVRMHKEGNKWLTENISGPYANPSKDHSRRKQHTTPGGNVAYVRTKRDRLKESRRKS